MATSELKQRVLEYVMEADEPLLLLMESLAAKFKSKTANEAALTEEQWKIVEERWERHLRGETRSYSLEEVKESIIKARRDGL